MATKAKIALFSKGITRKKVKVDKKKNKMIVV